MGEQVTSKAWESAAIVRQCRRCRKYKSINAFVELGKLCRGCTESNSGSYYRTDYKGLGRGLVLTDKGREAIKEMRSIA